MLFLDGSCNFLASLSPCKKSMNNRKGLSVKRRVNLRLLLIPSFFLCFVLSNFVDAHTPVPTRLGGPETLFCESKGFTHIHNHIGNNANFYDFFRFDIEGLAFSESDIVACEAGVRYCELFTGLPAIRDLTNTAICIQPPDGTCPHTHFGHFPNCISVVSGEANNLGGTCSVSTSNPINIPTGNKFFQFTDYKDKDFAFIRSYNSWVGDWRFAYQQRLIIHDNYFVVAERPDGKGLHFTNSNGIYSARSQRREILSFDGTVYTLLFPNNTIETYDANGRLLYIDSQYEERLSLSYIENQIIISKSGNELVLTLGENGEVIQALFPNGVNIIYTYQQASKPLLLKSLLYSTSESEQYFYEDIRFPTYITGIEDKNGYRISSVQYDAEGRAISSERGPLNSGVERTQIQYNSDGTRTLTNALGKQSTYHFTQFNGEYKMTQVEGHPSANCAGANKNYTYDTNGYMASKTDWKGNTTTYINNDRGQELSRTEASGTPQARTITTEWHATYNLPTKITEPSRVITMTYDTNGRLLSRNVTER